MKLSEAKKLLDVKTPSIETLAKKHNVTVDKIKQELERGIKVELEHTTQRKVAEEIALDHINELLDYYIRLQKVESN